MADWDQRYLDLAQYWANVCSKDPNTAVGSVIINNDNRIVSLGYNGFPVGVSDDVNRLKDRSTKHIFMQHAERNALDNAETPVRGYTLYATLKPCSECAKSIVQKGISRVVYNKPTREDIFGWEHTDTIFGECGIEVVEI